MHIKTGKISTMNDLNEDELFRIRDKYINDNISVLNMYLTKIEICKLRQTLFSRVFGRPKQILIPKEDLIESKHRFSKKYIIIPKVMNFLVEFLIEKATNVNGIFRINVVHDRISALQSIIQSITEKKISFELAREIINKSFTVFDIAETYKRMFKKFNFFVIPDFFIHIATKIEDIRIEEHKIICCKCLLFGVPKRNRMLLESVIFLCNCIVLQNQKAGNSNRQMGMMGLGVVMTPNLINFDSETVQFEHVKKLSEFICWLFENFEELVKIE